MKLDRISSNLNRMNGQPTIRNLRFIVRRAIELLAIYSDREELRQEFPELEDEDIRQDLIFASSYFDIASSNCPINMKLLLNLVGNCQLQHFRGK